MTERYPHLKLGRKPAIFNRHSMRSALIMADELKKIGKPPEASNDYTKAVTMPWGMMLNDKLGCCVCSDTGHTLMLRTANAAEVTVIPKDDDILKLYEIVGGYVPGDEATDQGCNESHMCHYLVKTGFLGHKAAATGRVDPHRVDDIKWCIQLFGSCRIGINMPDSAMDQFEQGQPWDMVPGSVVEGGHDVPLVKYEGDTFYCVTWGKLHPITRSFLTTYTEEAHSELFPDWVREQGTAPSGLSLEELTAKLRALDH